MNYANAASILNNTIVPNVLGQDTTIAEDLSNINDLGTALSAMDGDTLKNYMKDFAVGVSKNFMDNRKFKEETYGMFIDSARFGGAVARVKARLLKAYDTPILTLEDYNADSSAPDYNDGHFYGTGLDQKLYTKDHGFMVPFSRSMEMWARYFTSADGVMELISLIEDNAENTLTIELNGLARSLLRTLIVSAHNTREIKLISAYNTEFNLQSGDADYVTLSNWKNQINFKLWCEETIENLRKYITDVNMKYNDGSVTTFTPEADTRVTLLTEFDSALKYALSNVYHESMANGVGEHYTVNFWQNQGDQINPKIKSGSLHDQIKESDLTINHVVGVIYDRLSCGITDKLEKTTTAYIPKGDFITNFHHVVKSHWVDTRNTAISLVLA